jgi:hypothetical protein
MGAEVSLDKKCHQCGTPLNGGFARCQNTACRALRQEYAGFERVVADSHGFCVYSGAATDVRLPNGHYLWAPYLLDFIEEGWLDKDLAYTPEYYDAHPGFSQE